MEAEKKGKAPKKNWTKGLQAEFKKIIWPDRQTIAVVVITAITGVLISAVDGVVLQVLNLLIK